MRVPRLSGRIPLQEVRGEVTNFIEPAHRGLPIPLPPYADTDILPLSLVAAPGHSAGAAAAPLGPP
jgi:hypothetical protein